METAAMVIDAFAQLGIDVRSGACRGAGEDAEGRVEPSAGLVLDPEGVATQIEVQRFALIDEGVAERLLAQRDTADEMVLLVVGDRVTDAARRVLLGGRAGYLDLRGRLAVRFTALVVDADVEPVTGRPARTDALSGRVGLEVAVALLLHPERPLAVRALARELGRSPSTVSEVLGLLRRDGLVETGDVVAGPDLFWQVAHRWAGPLTYLASLPLPEPADPGPDGSDLAGLLGLGLDDPEGSRGWALTDSVAALAYGAPVALRSDQPLTFLVPAPSVIRRATTLLGAAAAPAAARAAIRVAPVPAATTARVDPHTGITTGTGGTGILGHLVLPASASRWPLAHPLFVALDLAQDAGRGREILQEWTPDGRWPRVW